MSIQRRHYKAIATILNKYPQTEICKGQLIADLIEFFVEDNELFNEDKFRELLQ